MEFLRTYNFSSEPCCHGQNIKQKTNQDCRNKINQQVNHCQQSNADQLSPSHTLVNASMRCFESVAHLKQACSPHKDYHVLAALQIFYKMLHLNLEPLKRLDASSIKHKRIRGLLMGLTCDTKILIHKSSTSLFGLELICWFSRH